MRTFSLLVLTLVITSVWASDVIDLTKDSFQTTVNPELLMLVEFFAPWCGHCKALAPQYEEAATLLKPNNIKLAKVDCTAETELCSSHGVNGYPTLKVFRNGTPTDYSGTRKTDGIVSYMKKQALPAVSNVKADNHAEFTKADKIVIISYLDSTDSIDSDLFNSFANLHRDDYLFGSTVDPKAFELAGILPPSIVLYKTFDEGRNDLTGSFTLESLGDFVGEHSIPLLDEISPENFASYAEAGIPLAYIFIPSNDPNRETLTKSIEPIARDRKGKINFVWIDATKFADHAKSLNLQEAKWPAFAIQNIQEMSKYPLDQTKTVDAKTVDDFVKRFAAGEIAPSVKSEPKPASQDGPVYVLTANEFESFVADEKKDLLVEFYAPWCGHCKKLAPTWDTLGEKFTGSKDKLIIAKFDATANDVPTSAGFKVQGFPTIKFRPAGLKAWMDYEGDRSLESFIEYIDANATNDVKVDPVIIDPSSEQIIFGSGEEAAGHDEL